MPKDPVDQLTNELVDQLQRGTFNPGKFARRREELLGPEPNFFDNIVIPIWGELRRKVRLWREGRKGRDKAAR